MKTFAQFLNEAKTHTINVNYDSEHVDRDELEGHADTNEVGHGYDLTSGREDVQYEYNHKQHARAAMKRIKKHFGKHVHVTLHGYKDEE